MGIYPAIFKGVCVCGGLYRPRFQDVWGYIQLYLREWGGGGGGLYRPRFQDVWGYIQLYLREWAGGGGGGYTGLDFRMYGDISSYI